MAASSATAKTTSVSPGTDTYRSRSSDDAAAVDGAVGSTVRGVGGKWEEGEGPEKVGH